MKPNSFPRSQHLKSPQKINDLFAEGSSTSSFPIRFQYIATKIQDENIEIRIKAAFSVPKRKFKKAVDRNRIKRQMIEIYRLNNEKLEQELHSKNQFLEIMVIYLGDRMPEYNYLEKKFLKALEKLCINI